MHRAKVWVVAGKNAAGKLIGFLRTTGKLYFSAEEANFDITKRKLEGFSTVECVIMTNDDYTTLKNRPAEDVLWAVYKLAEAGVSYTTMLCCVDQIVAAKIKWPGCHITATAIPGSNKMSVMTVQDDEYRILDVIWKEEKE